MPAPQFHLSFGALVAQHAGAPAAIRQACAADPVYTRLGAIFHDLSYYRPELGNMLVEAVRYGLEGPALCEPWGYRMHSVEPGRFVASFIRAASKLDRTEGLALVGGLLSHCALDLALHPLVNHCARRDLAIYGGHESVHHRLTEKYHALFFHLDRGGEDPIGLRDFWKNAVVVKEGRWWAPTVESRLIDFMQDAYRGAYGDAPDGRTWSGWVRNFRHFGALVSTPLARRNSLKKRRIPELRTRYFENDQFSFWRYYALAEQRLTELLTLGYEYFSVADFSPEAEEAFVWASEIDDLAEPASPFCDWGRRGARGAGEPREPAVGLKQ